MAIYSYGAATPRIHETAYVADAATVVGDVTLGFESSVWFNAVLRGDNEPITIGEGSSVQDGAILHNDTGFPLIIGAFVTVGHQAMLHGCTVGDGSLIGIQAVVLNGAVIGQNCLVAAGSVVTAGAVFPDGSLIMGSPAKAVRQLSDADIAKMLEGAVDYVNRSRRYMVQLNRVDTDSMSKRNPGWVNNGHTFQ